MKYRFIFLLLLYVPIKVISQKPPLDPSAYGKWTSADDPKISNDGKYVSYTNQNIPLGSKTLVVQSTAGNWRMDVIGGSAAEFTQDSRRIIYKNEHDSLALADLGGHSSAYIGHVVSFQLQNKSMGEWMAYQINQPLNAVILRNLASAKEDTIRDVTDYLFSPEGSGLLVQTKGSGDSVGEYCLKWIDLKDYSTYSFWMGGKAGNFLFNGNSGDLAFSVEDPKGNLANRSFWYHRSGASKAIFLADDRSIGGSNNLHLSRPIQFSKDRSRLLILLESSQNQPPDPNKVRLNIWSYSDSVLQSHQISVLQGDPIKVYHAVLFLADHQILQLSFDNEFLYVGMDADFGLINARKGDGSRWNKFADSTFIVSTITGNRKFIEQLSSPGISPDGKFLVYFNKLKQAYFSYNTQTSVVRNIVTSGAIKDAVVGSTYGSSIAGWVDGFPYVLLYDSYDIWQVDLNGIAPPINLTNGYGRKHQIRFRFIKDLFNSPASPDERMVVSAFNKATKDNGFFKIEIGHRLDPSLLTMGPFTFYAPQKWGSVPGGDGNCPIKAKDVDMYIVRRMSAESANNVYSTKDFKKFRQLSDIAPEKNYNWMTTELLTWKTGGGVSQGILYKPENFNPARKYPVIFYYYNFMSDDLNSYLTPEPSDGGLNLAWYVSNGYLVFEPDINSRRDNRLESSLNTIVSAANYLASFSFVDSGRMGLQGISWGGIQTNYIVTHSNIFAAAVSSSSMSDFISAYGGVTHGGLSGEEFPGSAPASLWERPDWYLQFSPVMSAHKVSTPLLLFETTHDDACPFPQAIELFTDLRRLGKKVWMLEYEEGDHAVSGKSAEDFSLRMSQFFNYYLKGAPAPKWMVRGIPASNKGIDTGLELEPPGIGPGPGLLTPEEERKVQALKNRRPIVITIP